MPKRGGKSHGELGRAMVRDKDRKRRAAPTTHDKINFYPTDIEETQKKNELNKLNSLTQTSDLGDFLLQADLAEKEFFAEKQNVVILTTQSYTVRTQATAKQLELQLKHANDLKIPRRPAWDATMTPLELDHNEKQCFLEWRKTLATLEQQEDLVLTPFEKNLEVWRQLWRVVERSNVIVQIVDARNPMVMCTDLDKYVQEVDPAKKSLLLVNKADLLTTKQRLMWTRYFHSKGLHFLFWSANYEKLRQEEREAELKRLELEEAGIIDAESKPAVRHRQPRQPQPEEESSEEDDNEEAETEAEEGPLSNDEGGNADADAAANTADGEEEGEEEEGEQHEEVQLTTNETVEATTTTTTTTSAEANVEADVEAEKKAEAEAEEDGLSEEEVEKLAKVHGIDELLEHILSYCPPKEKGGGITVGMVGYPNVGKSSTINVLCGEKKVNVSMTPGKTKHLQTIKLSDQIMLCDCPGLVFPSFLTTKADMICSGLLPIDHMRDPRPPTALVCERIPRSILEGTYGIMLPKPTEEEDPNRVPTPSELLKAYGRIRGFMTVHGSPDESRAARIILKDYVSGKLLYCHPVPGKEKEYTQWWDEENAREQYKSFGWDVKETLRLPTEEDTEAVKLRRERLAERKSGHVSYDERQNQVLAHSAGRRKGKKGFTRVQNTYHSVVPVRKIAQAQIHAIQQRHKAAQAAAQAQAQAAANQPPQ